MLTVGVISDTHGLLRENAVSRLRECDLIIHAGDIGNIRVLETLSGLKQVIAVKGNMDHGSWTEELQETRIIELEGKRIYLIHNVHDIEIDPVKENIQVVIYGHSHKAEIKKEKGVLYFNPGSAGPRRFSLPVTLGLLRIDINDIQAEIIDIKL